MCLITQSNLGPFTAKKDLKVTKLLITCKEGGIITPYRSYPVELNRMLIPTENSMHITKKEVNDCRAMIYEGSIHAYLILDDYVFCNASTFNRVAEAYILKGTKYYIDISLNEICAEKLYITDKIAEEPELAYNEMLDVIQPIINTIPTNKISSGWIYTSDKRIIHPNNISESDDTIGVVAYVDNNNIIIFDKCDYYTNFDDTTKLCDFFKGWKVPSVEVLEYVFSNNLMQVNAALYVIKNKMLACQDNSCYWSSFVYDSFYAQYCMPINAKSYKWYKKYRETVRLSLTLDKRLYD